MTIAYVLTEQSSYLTPEQRERYERTRARLEEVAGSPVHAIHYPDVDDHLRRADVVVLSGSSAPWAAHDPRGLDRLGEAVRSCERPVLGICAGHQLLAMFAGGSVAPMAAAGRAPERGYLELDVVNEDDLLRGVGRPPVVYQDHEDEVIRVPDGFNVLARTPGCPVQAMAAPDRRWWGTQFHPELSDGEHPDGERILRNFFALARSAS